jgi:hypothetical protein
MQNPNQLNPRIKEIIAALGDCIVVSSTKVHPDVLEYNPFTFSSAPIHSMEAAVEAALIAIVGYFHL